MCIAEPLHNQGQRRLPARVPRETRGVLPQSAWTARQTATVGRSVPQGRLATPGLPADSAGLRGPSHLAGRAERPHILVLTDFLRLPLRRSRSVFNVVVETPRGSPVKLEYDTKHKVFAYGHPLMLGLAYPYDWGFFPRTQAQDGDPLDALVLHESATYPGVVFGLSPHRRCAADGKTGRQVSHPERPRHLCPGCGCQLQRRPGRPAPPSKGARALLSSHCSAGQEVRSHRRVVGAQGGPPDAEANEKSQLSARARRLPSGGCRPWDSSSRGLRRRAQLAFVKDEPFAKAHRGVAPPVAGKGAKECRPTSTTGEDSVHVQETKKDGVVGHGLTFPAFNGRRASVENESTKA